MSIMMSSTKVTPSFPGSPVPLRPKHEVCRACSGTGQDLMAPHRVTPGNTVMRLVRACRYCDGSGMVLRPQESNLLVCDLPLPH